MTSPKTEISSESSTKVRKYLVADLFCGAGGSSTGAQRAITKMGGTMELVAVNHWSIAIETHQLNHPNARHYVHDLESADPETLVPEGRLDLLMASPECRFFSRARGGKPIHDQGRMNPWAVQRWLTAINIRCVLIENVPEFIRWGPLDDEGKPIKKRAGEYFEAWVRALRSLGYDLEWQFINAADYGEATSRKRFFLQARNDGNPIVWPEPTHSQNGEEGLFGKLPKWRGAKEIIDWNNNGRSLLDDPKYVRNPLSINTRRRIARGLQKFGGPLAYLYIRLLNLPPEEEREYEKKLDNNKPFILNRNGENGSDRIHDISEPCPTATGRGAGYLVIPAGETPPNTNQRLVGANRNHNTPKDTEEPIPTVTTAPGGGIYMVETESIPFMLGQQSGGAPRDTAKPVPTIVASGGNISLIETSMQPAIIEYYGTSTIRDVDQPLTTVTASRKHAFMQLTIKDPVTDDEQDPKPDMDDAIVVMVNHGNGKQGLEGDKRRAMTINDPLPTITTRHGMGLARTIMVQTSQTGGNGDYSRTTEQPLPTITTKNDIVIAVPTAEPYIVPNFGEHPRQEPRTHDINAPLPAITGHGAGNLVTPHADQIEAHKNCPTETDHRRLIYINGILCVLDIRFRMLQNNELARAMGFEDEESQYEFVGKVAEITKQIGNAVPVRVATALVRSILQEP